MTMLLLRKYWLSLLLAVLAVFAVTWAYQTGNRAGRATVQAQWDKDIAEREKAQRAEKERLENEYANRVQTAIAERDAQIKRVQADADNARAAVGGLRQQLAQSRGRIATAPAAAVADYAHAAADVLGECTAEYQRVAEKADGHAADAAALMQAWPGVSFGGAVER